MFFNRLIIASILFFNTLFDFQTDRTLFIPPVTIPLALSANFGELRVDHYHSGIDIKTQGVTGKEVVAAADGYVSRIGVSPTGFGNALYIRHPSGYSTVYGHLERCVPEIAAYVKARQYENKSFTVTLFPPKEKFQVKQGDIIAFSGNSGGSGGPHLHFEVRKADSEIPVNPLLFSFGPADNIKPVIEKLFVYPIYENSLINNSHRTTRISISGSNGNYYIPAGNDISISGTAGFGIKSYDQLNDNYNKCGIYSIELRIDSSLKFSYVMDEFSFSESRFINSHIDYETYIRENSFIERTFVLPNDKLSVYKNAVNRGIFNFTDGKTHHIQITVMDAQNNKAVLGFNVKSIVPANTNNEKQVREGVMMPYNRNNRFRAENISVSIPSGALYDTLFFIYKRDTGTPQMLSDVHYVHNKYTPLQKPYSLSIKPTSVPAGKESKMLIVHMSDDFRKSGINSSYSDGYVTGDVLSFGMFFAGIDTVAPSIYANGLQSGSDLTGRSELRIKITDDLSGIKSYEPTIDGKWALFEYDQKNDVLIYRFDPDRITKGTTHSLTLKVTDNKDNQGIYSCDFKW
jgi:Membrane proteins related to metalloendopeptidases